MIGYLRCDCVLFFFQAEDGIRDLTVTGVQTCALPICEDGIFGDHLRRMLAALTQDTELCDAVRAVLKGKPCPTTASFYRLRSAGVLAEIGRASCRERV